MHASHHRFLGRFVSICLVICFSVVFSNTARAEPTVAPGFMITKMIDGSPGEGLSGLGVDSTGSYGNRAFYVGQGSGTVYRIDGQGVSTPFATVPSGSAYDIAFDTSGDFGGLMYVSAITNGTGADRIYAIAPNGTVSLFFSGQSLMSKGIGFGQGGAFGTDLYAMNAGAGRLLRITPNGNASSFSSGLGPHQANDDLAISTGGPLGDFIYLTRVQGDDVIQRVSSSGVSETWTNALGGKSIAIGSGDFGDFVYGGGPQSAVGEGIDSGTIMRYDATGAREVFAEGFSTGNDNPVRGLAITNDEMWTLSVTDLAIYKITPLYCDFDNDGDCDEADADALTSVGNLLPGISVPPADPKFDLTDDSNVNSDDLAEWLSSAGSANGFDGPVRRGDTNVDGDVDTDDLTKAIIKYSGVGATTNVWSDGDNDGDGDTDTVDLTNAIVNFTGLEAASPNVPDLIYDPATGNVAIDADGADMISFSLQGGPFNSADFSELPAGLTDNIASQIGWTSFNLFSGLTGTANLGTILPAGLDLAGLEALLATASYGLALSVGGGGGTFDLIIPEPTSLVLIGLLAIVFAHRSRRPRGYAHTNKFRTWQLDRGRFA